jgi:SNF2 family DNA or RNA helicase
MKQSYRPRDLILLTGTPLSTPADIYGYSRFLNPNWLTKGIFEAHHVAEYDHFGKPVKWKNQDELQKVFMEFACRVQQEDVLTDLPEIYYEPFVYALNPEHQKIYDKVVKEKLLELKGQKDVSFNNASAAAAALQQVVIGVEKYAKSEAEAQKLRKKIAGLEVIDLTMGKIGDEKMIIFAYYQKSIEVMVDHCKERGWNPAEISGRISNNQKSIEKFKEDPTCKVIIIQVISGGSGLEFQDVCRNVLFMEFPKLAKDFRQAVARVYRKGQKLLTRVWIATALKTVQVRQQKRVLERDEEVNQVQITYKDLQDYLYGDE